MFNLDFLSKNDIVGSNSYSIFKPFGSTTCNLTDFAIITGAFINTSERDHPIKKGYYFTKSPCDNRKEIYSISPLGDAVADMITTRSTAIRLTIPMNAIKDLENKIFINKGIEMTEFGEYPQEIMSHEKYPNFYNNSHSLKKTGKTYTINKNTNTFDSMFSPQTIEEYQDGSIKAVQVNINLCDSLSISLSDNNKYNSGDIVFVMVKPIRWLIDRQAQVLISDKLLLSGIPFDLKNEYYGSFEQTFIYNFINTYLLNEMFDNRKNNNSYIDNGISKSKSYPHINERIEEIKKRVKKLQERR